MIARVFKEHLLLLLWTKRIPWQPKVKRDEEEGRYTTTLNDRDFEDIAIQEGDAAYDDLEGDPEGAEVQKVEDAEGE